MALAVAVTAIACAPAVKPVRCDRFDGPSMGPENSFRVTIAEGAVPPLDGAPSRIDVAVASAAPLEGPVTLVQSAADGRELGRWELTLAPAPGIVKRCSLGFVASSCGATLSARPQTTTGTWAIAGDNKRLLEASIAFRHCTGPR